MELTDAQGTGWRTGQERQEEATGASRGRARRGLQGDVRRLLDLRPQEILLVASGTDITEPLGCDTMPETCQREQRFPKTVHPSQETVLFIPVAIPWLFPHWVTKLVPRPLFQGWGQWCPSQKHRLGTRLGLLCWCEGLCSRKKSELPDPMACLTGSFSQMQVQVSPPSSCPPQQAQLECRWPASTHLQEG